MDSRGPAVAAVGPGAGLGYVIEDDVAGDPTAGHLVRVGRVMSALSRPAR